MKDSVYTPEAGRQPPVLAGRDELLRDVTLMRNEVANRGRVSAILQRIARVDISVVGFGGGLSTHPDAAARTTQLDAADLANLLANLAEVARSASEHGGVMLAVDEMQVIAAHNDLPIHNELSLSSEFFTA